MGDLKKLGPPNDGKSGHPSSLKAQRFRRLAGEDNIAELTCINNDNNDGKFPKDSGLLVVIGEGFPKDVNPTSFLVGHNKQKRSSCTKQITTR